MAKQVNRQRLQEFWADVLKELEEERKFVSTAGGTLSKSFVDKAAKACDQIRRDFPDKPDQPTDPTTPADDDAANPFGNVQLAGS